MKTILIATLFVLSTLPAVACNDRLLEETARAERDRTRIIQRQERRR